MKNTGALLTFVLLLLFQRADFQCNSNAEFCEQCFDGVPPGTCTWCLTAVSTDCVTPAVCASLPGGYPYTDVSNCSLPVCRAKGPCDACNTATDNLGQSCTWCNTFGGSVGCYVYNKTACPLGKEITQCSESFNCRATYGANCSFCLRDERCSYCDGGAGVGKFCANKGATVCGNTTVTSCGTADSVHCENYTQCSQCEADPICTWCSFGAGFNPACRATADCADANEINCTDCTKITDCQTCADDPACNYCTKLGTCNSLDGVAGTCPLNSITNNCTSYDPCVENNSGGCDACVAAGCVWCNVSTYGSSCVSNGSCSDPTDVALNCSIATDTCPDLDNNCVECFKNSLCTPCINTADSSQVKCAVGTCPATYVKINAEAECPVPTTTDGTTTTGNATTDGTTTGSTTTDGTTTGNTTTDGTTTTGNATTDGTTTTGNATTDGTTGSTTDGTTTANTTVTTTSSTTTGTTTARTTTGNTTTGTTTARSTTGTTTGNTTTGDNGHSAERDPLYEQVSGLPVWAWITIGVVAFVAVVIIIIVLIFLLRSRTDMI